MSSTRLPLASRHSQTAIPKPEQLCFSKRTRSAQIEKPTNRWRGNVVTKRVAIMIDIDSVGDELGETAEGEESEDIPVVTGEEDEDA